MAEIGVDYYDPVKGGLVQQNPTKSLALITAAGATVGSNSADQGNINWRGVKVVINMTVVGTGSITATIQGKDPVSGVYYTLLASAAIAANGTTVLTVYPGLTPTANVTANDVLPDVWRVSVAANNVNPTTYTVAACGLV
jgi:hypothetical protein